jgi:hypothetical protein
MGKVKCVEPGFSVEGKGSHVGVASADDELVFPHVDSCLGIALILSDNRMVGGHVGAFTPKDEYDPSGNTMKVLDEMLELAGQGQIAKIVCLGDSEWGTSFGVIEQIQNKVGKTKPLLFVRKNCKDPVEHGVDFTLDGKDKIMTVQRCDGPKKVLYNQPFDVVKVSKDVQI